MANKYIHDDIKTKTQDKSYAYSSSKRTQTTHKNETVLAKTKGYDELTKKDKEKRGRKNKK